MSAEEVEGGKSKARVDGIDVLVTRPKGKREGGREGRAVEGRRARDE